MPDLQAPRRPTIVGLGGTNRAGSSSERALRTALDHARSAGAEVELLTGREIDLPTYNPAVRTRGESVTLMLSALRRADGIILASPGYHGSMSGLIKNALDYVEDMRDDALPYFEGRAVGLIACAAGHQAGGTTLAAMRAVIHALRGWPTPLAVCINSAAPPLPGSGGVGDAAIEGQLAVLARQVVEFARMRALLARAGP
jgi:FMN reductase